MAPRLADAVWDVVNNNEVLGKFSAGPRSNLTQLSDDMPDENTKLVYQREESPRQDWLELVSRRNKTLSSNALIRPHTLPVDNPHAVDCVAIALMSTTHEAVPELPYAQRVQSFMVKGAVMWNTVRGARAVAVFSVPHDGGVGTLRNIRDVVVGAPDVCGPPPWKLSSVAADAMVQFHAALKMMASVVECVDRPPPQQQPQ